jgi:glutamine amidotransferase
MCRWAAYLGEPIFISDVLSAPQHSLIDQSRAASECKTVTNGDGFGLAWYGARPEPGLYRDVYPAWSDPNLASLAQQVQSGLFLAHVRASTGTATSRNNCHPFVAGQMAFMHNGQIGGFDRFRKAADMMIPDDLYGDRRGATDSEALFLVALGYGLAEDPAGALERAVGEFQALSEAEGSAPHMRMTAAFSDGQRLFAVRYASDRFAPSLYYCRADRGWLVVSEPLDPGQDWIAVEPGQFCTFDRDQVWLEPFEP